MRDGIAFDQVRVDLARRIGKTIGRVGAVNRGGYASLRIGAALVVRHVPTDLGAVISEVGGATGHTLQHAGGAHVVQRSSHGDGVAGVRPGHVNGRVVSRIIAGVPPSSDQYADDELSCIAVPQVPLLLPGAIGPTGTFTAPGIGVKVPPLTTPKVTLALEMSPAQSVEVSTIVAVSVSVAVLDDGLVVPK